MIFEHFCVWCFAMFCVCWRWDLSMLLQSLLASGGFVVHFSTRYEFSSRRENFLSYSSQHSESCLSTLEPMELPKSDSKISSSKYCVWSQEITALSGEVFIWFWQKNKSSCYEMRISSVPDSSFFRQCFTVAFAFCRRFYQSSRVCLFYHRISNCWELYDVIQYANLRQVRCFRADFLYNQKIKVLSWNPRVLEAMNFRAVIMRNAD